MCMINVASQAGSWLLRNPRQRWINPSPSAARYPVAEESRWNRYAGWTWRTRHLSRMCRVSWRASVASSMWSWARGRRGPARWLSNALAIGTKDVTPASSTFIPAGPRRDGLVLRSPVSPEDCTLYHSAHPFSPFSRWSVLSRHTNNTRRHLLTRLWKESPLWVLCNSQRRSWNFSGTKV